MNGEAAGPADIRSSPLQPLLHDDIVVLSAPTQAWSSTGGDIGGADGQPIHGIYQSDVRVLSRVTLSVGGEVPEPISHARSDASTIHFTALLRRLDDRSADPKVRLDRVRTVEAGSLTETLTFSSALADPVATDVEIELAPDFSQMHAIKSGTAVRELSIREPSVREPSIREPSISESGPTLPIPNDASASTGREVGSEGLEGPRWHHGSLTATLTAPDATVTSHQNGSRLSWQITIPSRGSITLTWSIAIDDASAVVAAAPGESPWASVRVTSGDSRIANWVHTALDDLTALRMTATASAAPNEPFLAAGAPWFFTLFGRDSIWAARFLLPFGTELAASTLRVLAALQGTRDVAETAEQPGKIMHELRASTQTIPGEDVSLPPLYYGTIDATPLWAILLHDAWRWGMPDTEVQALLPNLEAALAWMRDFGDSDGDGFLEYVDTTGHGLANQGWKDSGDSIQWANGALAEGPIALCEVQAYAFEAAVGGAEILEHFGQDAAATSWRDWAAALKQRFAASFWVDSPSGRYPAVALDAHKKRVDSVTSNIGHLLGTGLLNDDESRLVADRLVSPQLSSGYGLRTLSTDAAGFWPLSYHGGAVWTHDTAIAIAGLGRAGFGDEAGVLIEGLLAAASGFDYRMPELHSGDAASDVSSPVPYPAACRPQAWSAAAAVAVLQTLLGLEPGSVIEPIEVEALEMDALEIDHSSRLSVAPLPMAAALSVDGLRFGARSFSITTDATGTVTRNTLS